MKKFRVLSDLHLDINDRYPLTIDDKSVFTVICGDTSGYPDMSVEWIKENCPNGVGCSGNHLPYNEYGKTVQELREELARALPANGQFTYMDCETGCFSKEVDGILFIGTCMYSDMKITHPRWNPDGSDRINKCASMHHMNDYRYGIARKDYPAGSDNEPTNVKMTADDYAAWFENAFAKIDKLLTDNESRPEPLPVVLFTHYNLITSFLEHNWYLDKAHSCRSYNWSSYASDRERWLKNHPSIKCYCCGHVHAVEREYRHFDITRDDGSRILVVNNARGYLHECHDTDFNPNLFVNTETWQVECEPLTEADEAERKARGEDALKRLAWFW